MMMSWKTISICRVKLKLSHYLRTPALYRFSIVVCLCMRLLPNILLNFKCNGKLPNTLSLTPANRQQTDMYVGIQLKKSIPVFSSPTPLDRVGWGWRSWSTPHICCCRWLLGLEQQRIALALSSSALSSSSFSHTLSIKFCDGAREGKWTYTMDVGSAWQRMARNVLHL